MLSNGNMRKHRVQKIDGGWGWMIVLGTFFMSVALSGVTRSQGIILQAMIKYYDATTSEVTMVTTVSTLLHTICCLFATVLGDRYTARLVVVIAGLGGCLGMCLASLGFSVLYIACTFGIGLGIANGLAYGNCLSMVGRYFRKKRALANSLALSGASVGQMLLPPLIHMVVEEYSVKGAFLIIGGLYLHFVVFGALYRPIEGQLTPEVSFEALVSVNALNEDEFDSESRIISQSDLQSRLELNHLRFTDILRSKILREESIISQIGAAGGSTTSKIFFPYASGENIMSASLLNLQQVSQRMEMAFSIISLEAIEPSSKCSSCSCRRWNLPKIIDFSVLKNIKCAFFCIIFFFMHFTGFSFFLFLPSIVAERGIAPYQAGLLLSIIGAADLLGRLGCGLFANFGICERYKIVSACGVVLGINILAFGFLAHEFWLMALQSAINGAVYGGYITLLSVVLIDCLGLELLPRILGVVLFCQGLGPTAGQAFLGWLRDRTGDFDTVLLIMGATGILAGSALLLYPIAKKLEDQRVLRLEERRKRDDVQH